jgi:pimeloyl-ACP methyl ester carboxylesterase
LNLLKHTNGPALFLAVLLLLLPTSASSQTKPAASAKSTSTAAKPTAQPATLEGNWAGSLQAGDAVLHLVLHVAKAADGSWKATLDSLDQGVYGIEVTTFAQNESTLNLAVSSVGASYEGKVSSSHQTIDGLWSQGGAGLPLVFHREARGAGTKAPSDAVFPVEGVWQGALETTGMRLRLQLHISHDDKKHLVASLDSPDQGVNGLPATRVEQKDFAFHFEIPLVNGNYDGTLNTAHNSITGIWSQTGDPKKLDFKRSDQLLELLRPQIPAKPYPYQEQDITFSSPKDNISLAATLTLPQGKGPFPAAILISGSGPHDRDESIAGHRPFLVLADHLTRKGFAVLRYDKRGIAKSTGNYGDATSVDFANDAEAAISYLKSRKEIDPKKIGLIGHSEGGEIAPMVAVRSSDVAWIVLLAGPAVKGENLILRQSELIERTANIDEALIQKSLTFDLHVYALVRQEKDRDTLETKIKDLVKSTGMNDSMAPAALQGQIKMVTSPWFRFFLDYDPIPTLQQVKCPVLALNGEKDLQVPAKDNLPLVEKALTDGGNKDFQTAELPELNHLFQHCQTGSPTEYGSIEETISPGVLDRVTEWMQKHTSLLSSSSAAHP